MYGENKDGYSEKKVRTIAADLFCGAGGLTRGLLDAGIEVRVGIDYDDSFKRTYDENNKPSRFHKMDIKRLTGQELEGLLKVQPNELSMLAACAPCQPFSRHNKNHYHDRRKSLISQVGRILHEMQRKPDFIFFENVPAIIKIDKGRQVKMLCKNLNRLGYNYKIDIVDAKDYGTPQTRKRFILIGILKTHMNEPVSFPVKTHGKGRLPYKTVSETIKDLPRLSAGQRHDTIPNHECAGIEDINLRRLKHTPKNGGSRTAWPQELVLDCHIDHAGHKDVYGRMRWKEPSPTLTCKCVSISNGRFGHPSQLRGISLREAASLQSFPDTYEFFGMFGSMARQIGNAVPPLLAKVFGEHLIGLACKGNCPERSNT